MGIFANEPPEDAPKWIGPKPSVRDWNGESEFEAFGVTVPMFRRAAAAANLKQMGMSDTEKAFNLVEKMAHFIERDEPHAMMEHAAKFIDVTGVYRIMAVMLCEPQPALQSGEG